MRVLFVGSNAGGGGTESHFISLALALAESGHEVMAAVRPGDFIHRGLEGDTRIARFPVEFRSRRDLPTIHGVSRLARTLDPDWMIGAFKAEYWGLAIAAKIAGVPLALFSHLDQRIRPTMLSRVTKLVRGVIVPSNYLRRRKIERGLPPSRVAVLPNPVDLRHFVRRADVRARMRASLGLRNDDVLFGFVGRFEPAKGVETLAHAMSSAMARNPRLHALWVGHGKSEEALRAVVRDGGFGSRHHWMPWVDDVLPAYAAMDALSLPSEGSETFGRVLVEAQACGIPVLGARNGGIPEALVDGETGLLLPPGDVGQWTRAIESLADDAARRARMGGAGRHFATRFDGRRIAADFPLILDSFASGASVAAPHFDLPVTLASKGLGD